MEITVYLEENMSEKGKPLQQQRALAVLYIRYGRKVSSLLKFS